MIRNLTVFIQVSYHQPELGFSNVYKEGFLFLFVFSSVFHW